MINMSDSHASNKADLAILAKGGRTNVYGFVMRLIARLPFLFIAGQIYGAATLGRFAYAILIIEFAAQIATLGLKRGLAEQLSRTKRPHVHVVFDALVVSFFVSLFAALLLIAMPQIMFPNSAINGLDRFLPLIIIFIVGSDIALAALAYRYDIASTVRARSVIEPWAISIAALAFSFWNLRDGLLLSYLVSLVAAWIASIWPLIKSYGLPWGWQPKPLQLAILAKENAPLAAADAIEWGSRKLDLALLGLFAPPTIVGIYFVAQHIASLPQKLKTSFDPILGPVITRNLQDKKYAAIAAQVRQVGFWIIAAQAGVAITLSITGPAILALVGDGFSVGIMAAILLLFAEVIAATAAVSEAALVYVARHRNVIISLSMLGLQAGLSIIFLLFSRSQGWPEIAQGTAVACALMISLTFSSITKAWLLGRILKAPVFQWRWALILALSAASIVGYSISFLAGWVQLAVGIPAILISYSAVIWYVGFEPDERAMLRAKTAAHPV